MDVNDLVSGKHIINENHVLLDRSQWNLIDYNDLIAIEKNNSIDEYYFKSINDKYIICSKFKFRPQYNSNVKYTTVKILLTNIQNIYRHNKINTNIDLIELNNKIIELQNDNKMLKKKVNNIITIINNNIQFKKDVSTNT
jgi:hypothetical protein